MYNSSVVIIFAKVQLYLETEGERKNKFAKYFAISRKSTIFATENERYNKKYNPLSYVSKYQE
jgi:DNA-binding XRE family transcriptional regulator